ncbi:hypothetical protein [Nostoc sphaeroides]|uniref:Transposase n=1 Tax=Nostoc sphaeroides CCNUC1 TaxID=2653204 RepID=A0A5P8WIZ6_9NOSO|nr:hypothetical protein [Nostoc sphaeroides]QFS52798.1 hypothetical protein GXM_10062 [Nostoc sphaeroides CCNUC1]
MEKLNKGQVTWTELRKQYGSHVASAIAKIRKLNANLIPRCSKVDAQDRADLLRIDQKRKHALTEVAANYIKIYKQNCGGMKTKSAA